MKNCPNCGSQLSNDADTCPNCGKSLTVSQGNSKIKTATKVFLIISCIIQGIFLLFAIQDFYSFGIEGLSAIWSIPMTIHYFRTVNDNRNVGIFFKSCTLVLVSRIAGILMLCDND